MSRATVSRRSFERKSTQSSAIAAAAFAITIAGAMLAASPGSAGPSPQNLEVLALNENFEGVLGARGWSFVDTNPVSGDDFWASSTYRADTGNSSAYAAGVGDRLSVMTLFSSDFENGTAGWTFADRNNTDSAGVDTWGISTFRAHNGTSSIWCAQVGTNYYSGGSTTQNAQLRLYDVYQNSTAVFNTNLAGMSNVQLEYWIWQNSENSWDNAYVAYYDGSWHWENQQFPNMNAGGGWKRITYPIPSSATQVGFLFTSDASVIYEGVYIDDVKLYYNRLDNNRDTHLYDDNADAQMTHEVDVSYFDSARLEYRYFLDTASANDTLSVMLYDGTTWTYSDIHSGVSGGWAASSIPIPINTQKVGFRFFADGSGRSEGAYVDDLNVWGSVLPVQCDATAYETAGMEVVTPIHFATDASGGLRPYTFSWAFGDGAIRTGPLPSDQNPIHAFAEIGSYSPVVTVTDSLGQTCSSATASITITHDITTVFLTPATAKLTEGAQVTVYGFDGQGHPYALDWDLQFPECGQLSTTHGTQVTVTAATDSGGTVCQVVGSVGSTAGAMRLTVGQDTSVIHVSPLVATVTEGRGLRLAATDRYGGELPFLWTTTCGRVGGSAASFTLFEAVIEGGVVCTVTAAYGADHAEAIITIIHDTGNIDVTPKSASLIEGSGQSFTAVDGYGHPFDAEWSVDPAACGAFSIRTGASTTFTTDIDAGGMECTVRVAYGADNHDVGVSVLHDLRDSSVTPSSASVQGGTAVEFHYGDANGHPFSAIWSVSPGGCGSFNPNNGTTTTITVSGDYAGYTCTVSGTGIGFTRFASVVVEYGTPTTVVVTPSSDVVEANGQVLVSAAVKDAAGHTIPLLQVDWTTTGCGGGAVAPARGATTTLSAPESAAGTICAVTATYAGVTGTANVRVNHLGPFTVKVLPEAPALGAGQTQVFSATVTDGAGAPVPDAAIVWSSTCGQLSNTTGPSVVFTAPADVSNANCEVTAAASAGGVAYQSGAQIKAGGSPMLLLLLGALGALAAVGLVAMRMRGRGGGAQVPISEAAPASTTEAAMPGTPEAPVMAAPPPGDAAPAAGACPKCGAAVETGWTACPECGTDLPTA